MRWFHVAGRDAPALPLMIGFVAADLTSGGGTAATIARAAFAIAVAVLIYAAFCYERRMGRLHAARGAGA